MENTPLCKIHPLKHLNKSPKKGGDWKVGTVLQDIKWFGLKQILAKFPYEQASSIINSIKRHF